MNRSDRITLAASAMLGFLITAAGCERKQAETPAAPAENRGAASPTDDHGHDHGAGGDRAHDDHDHDGPVVDLGTAAAGPFSVKATRDAGAIVAGKDAAFDLTVAGADDAGPKVVAVRIWIGVESAKGSVKAKAEVEDPGRWHTHAEVPSPIPEGSRFWFEIEDDKGGRHVSSFELKP